MKQPELIIFDLDGTLLDTLESLALAYNSALALQGCPGHSVDAFRTIIGDGARVAAERCLPDDRQSEEDIAECVTLFQHHYETLWQTASPYPDIVDVLSTLKASVKLAVLSNKDDSFTQRCVTHFFPDTFEYILGHSPGVPHKPDPSGCKRIIQSTRVQASTTCLVGDTATDMKTAQACKVLGVGVLWGFRDQSELNAAGAGKIITAPRQLLELVDHRHDFN